MKNVTYDNIKSHKEAEVYPLSRKYILEKPQRDIKLTHPAPHPLPIFFKLKKIKTLQKWYTAYHHNLFQALSRKFRLRILGYSEKFGENIKLQVFTAKHMVFLQIFLRVMAEDK